MIDPNSPTRHPLRRRLALALLGVLIAATLQGQLFCQQNASAQTPAEQDREAAVLRWSEQLQSKSFAAREQASEKLFQLGYQILPSLRSLRSNMPESESKERLSKIIEALASDDLELRIKRFLEGEDSEIENWSYLKKWFGDSPRVRELFVDLYQRYPEVVASLDGNADEISSALRTVRRRWEQQAIFMRVMPQRVDTIALLMLMVTPDFDADREYDLILAGVLDTYSVTDFRKDKVLGEPLVRLVEEWMPRSDLVYREQVLKIALKWEMDIGLSMAVTTLQIDPPPSLLARCIQVIARQGLARDARLLEPLLQDQRVVYPGRILGRNRHDVLVCDVAAAGIAHLANVPVTEIGFTEPVNHEVFGVFYEALIIDLPPKDPSSDSDPESPSTPDSDQGDSEQDGSKLDDEAIDPADLKRLGLNQGFLQAIERQNRRKISSEALAKARAEIRQKAIKLLPPAN